MTDPEDNTNTRPISVAELLARNGSIGAPPVGGRRRRRRGNSDSVTVAELTGEIPIITDSGESSRRAAAQPPVRQRVDQAPAPAAEAPEPEVDTEAEALLESPIAMELDEEEVFASPDPRTSSDTAASPDTRTSPDTTAPEDDAAPEDATVLDGTPASEGSIAEATAPAVTAEEADYAAHLQQRDVDPLPLDFTSRPRRGQVDSAGFGAEQMSPDPVLDDDELVDLGPDVDFSDVLDKHAAAEESATLSSQVPSYLRSGSDTLFGGQSVADDLARRGLQPGPEDIDLGDDAARSDTEKKAEPTTQEGSALVRGVWIVAQCILAVAFGAGLFIAFDQLWRWNTIVALVLSVLVILGLVVGVRVVRKTEDIGSTLIAVAVGALVTLGPLALLQSH